jgi:hypothetical protein
MLRDVFEEILRRNKLGGREHPGMLVLLEEATALRSCLEREDRNEADRLLIRIVQTCRKANVLTVIAAQRPSASLMSTDVRAQAGVNVCLQVRTKTDLEMVLGFRPEADMPMGVGRALLDVGEGEPRLICVDWLQDEQWQALASRWREPLPLAAPEPMGTVSDVDPLLWLAREAVATTPEGRMTTERILETLGEDVAGTSDPAQLGRRLSALGWPARVQERVGGQVLRFRYAQDAPVPEADVYQSCTRAVPEAVTGPDLHVQDVPGDLL